VFLCFYSSGIASPFVSLSAVITKTVKPSVANLQGAPMQTYENEGLPVIIYKLCYNTFKYKVI